MYMSPGVSGSVICTNTSCLCHQVCQAVSFVLTHHVYVTRCVRQCHHAVPSPVLAPTSSWAAVSPIQVRLTPGPGGHGSDVLEGGTRRNMGWRKSQWKDRRIGRRSARVEGETGWEGRIGGVRKVGEKIWEGDGQAGKRNREKVG